MSRGKILQFRYQAYRRLKVRLGWSDSVVQATSLAVRLLLKDLQNHSDRSARLRELCSELGVRVDDFEEKEFLARTYQLQVIAVYEQLEEFLKALQRESPLSANWDSSGSNEDKLSWFWNNMSLEQRRNSLAVLCKDICNYYRLVRHEFLHSLGSEAKLLSAAEALRVRVRTQPEFGKLDAPSAYSAIGFDDFILFTRSVKCLAAWLCDNLRPSNACIADMILSAYKERYGRPITHLKKHREVERRRNAIKAVLMEFYSIGAEESDEVSLLLIEGPLA